MTLSQCHNFILSVACYIIVQDKVLHAGEIIVLNDTQKISNNIE